MRFKHLWIITTVFLATLATLIQADQLDNNNIENLNDIPQQPIPHQVTPEELEALNGEKFTFQVTFIKTMNEHVK